MKASPHGFNAYVPTPICVGISGRHPLLKESDEASLSALNKTRRSAVMLTNQFSIKHTFDHVMKKAMKMYSKRAFWHWYLGEGIPGAEFSCCYEDLRALQYDYEEVSFPTVSKNGSESSIE